jgi:transcriptional regulator GlxA family with amidase domain
MLNAGSAISGRSAPTVQVPCRPQVIDAIRYMEDNYAEHISLADLAHIAGLSLYRFVTVFSREIGISPHRYLCLVRVRAAQTLLREGVAPAIAAIEVGFFDQSHLCRHFRAACGMTPGQFIAGMATPEVVS